jgi:hypothetical protein
LSEKIAGLKKKKENNGEPHEIAYVPMVRCVVMHPAGFSCVAHIVIKEYQ